MLEGEVVYSGFRHVRRLEWTDSSITVADRIDGSGAHVLERRLVWAPDAPELDVVPAGETEDGWVAERFFERERTRISVVRDETRLPSESTLELRLPE